MILLIDNYDSFVYNLYQLVGTIRPDTVVIRNDQLTIADIEKMAPDAIIISPGPGKPEDTGICLEAIRHFAGKIPIFGVCIGLQSICTAFGGVVTYASRLMHGKTSPVTYEAGSRLFQGMPNPFPAARYHSLSASDDGEIMALEHTTMPVYGVQFHPESILTPDGRKILENFLASIQ